MSHFLDSILPCFMDVVAARQLVQVNCSYPGTMDSWRVEFRGDGLCLDVTSDRGDLNIHIRGTTTNDEWVHLDLVRLLVKGGVLQDSATIEEQCSFLLQHFDLIVTLFSQDQKAETYSNLKRLNRQVVRAMFPGGVLDEDDMQVN